MIETLKTIRTTINRAYTNWIQTANATEKMVNSPREQGENKLGKRRPIRQNIMKKDEK